MMLTAHDHVVMNDAPIRAAYSLTHQVLPTYLDIQLICSSNSYEPARQYLHEIFAICKHTGRRRVLLDKNIWAGLTMVEAFKLATEMAAEFHHVKLAVCGQPPAARAIEFGELVAANRGLNTRSFSDMDAARDWLLSGIESDPPVTR